MNFLKAGLGILIILTLIMATDKYEFNKLSNPPSIEFKKDVGDALDEGLQEKVMDAVWNNLYLFQAFDSMEASTGDNTMENTGSVALTLDGWEIATAHTATTASFLQKAQIPTLGASSVGLNKNLSWGRRQRFRGNFSYYDSIYTLNYDGQTGNFALNETVTGAGGATGVVIADSDGGTSGTLTLKSVTGTFIDNEALTGSVAGAATVNGTQAEATPNFTAYYVRGATPYSNYNHPYYGFKIVDGVLYGCTRNSGATESTVQLQTLSNKTAYVVEARYFPSDKVIFSVMNNSTLKMEEKGVITTNLPLPTNTNTETWYGFEISTDTTPPKVAHTVQLNGSFLEYLQLNGGGF
jgi:hypothetical protein